MATLWVCEGRGSTVVLG